MGEDQIGLAIHHLGDSKYREAVRSDSNSHAVATHPLGVKPSGNAFIADKDLRCACGRFGILPDEVLIQILGLLDAPALRLLGSTCKARE